MFNLTLFILLILYSNLNIYSVFSILIQTQLQKKVKQTKNKIILKLILIVIQAAPVKSLIHSLTGLFAFKTIKVNNKNNTKNFNKKINENR